MWGGRGRGVVRPAAPAAGWRQRQAVGLGRSIAVWSSDGASWWSFGWPRHANYPCCISPLRLGGKLLASWNSGTPTCVGVASTAAAGTLFNSVPAASGPCSDISERLSKGQRVGAPTGPPDPVDQEAVPDVDALRWQHRPLLRAEARGVADKQPRHLGHKARVGLATQLGHQVGHRRRQLLRPQRGGEKVPSTGSTRGFHGLHTRPPRRLGRRDGGLSSDMMGSAWQLRRMTRVPRLGGTAGPASGGGSTARLRLDHQRHRRRPHRLRRHERRRPRRDLRRDDAQPRGPRQGRHHGA